MRGIEVSPHLLEREEPILGAGVPEAEQMIGDGLRRIPPLTVRANGRIAEPLRQRRAVFADEQRHVAVHRRAQPQRLDDHELTRRIGQ